MFKGSVQEYRKLIELFICLSRIMFSVDSWTYIHIILDVKLYFKIGSFPSFIAYRGLFTFLPFNP